VYGRSKMEAERLCVDAIRPGLQVTVLRFTNVYGRRDHGRVIPSFLNNAAAGIPLTLYGGDQVLDFIWVEHAVDALVSAGLGTYNEGPLNVGSGIGTPLSALAYRIASLFATRVPVNRLPAREVEVSRFIADASLARKLLGLPVVEDPLRFLPRLLHNSDDQVGKCEHKMLGARYLSSIGFT